MKQVGGCMTFLHENKLSLLCNYIWFVLIFK